MRGLKSVLRAERWAIQSPGRESWKLRPEGDAGVSRQLGNRWVLVKEKSTIDRGGK